MAKIILRAFFDQPLQADQAMSNLLEADYKPVQSNLADLIEITLEVEENTKANAREILENFKAEKIEEIDEK